MSEGHTQSTSARGSRRRVVVAAFLGVLALALALAAMIRSPLPLDHPKTRRDNWLASGIAAAAFMVGITGRPRGLASTVVATANGSLAMGLASLALVSHSHLDSRVARPGVEAVQKAQMAYKQANGGYFDSRLDCLVTPSNCIPGYPKGARTFLTGDLARVGTVGWFEWSLRAGQSPHVAQAGMSASSAGAFAYIAVPIDPEYTGPFAYCADSAGTLCIRFDGARPVVTGQGTCDLAACSKLR
jgi:hypothetical protein